MRRRRAFDVHGTGLTTFHEGDAFSWDYVPDDVFKKAFDILDEAPCEPETPQTGCICRVLAAGSSVLDSLKWLASGLWARLYAQRDTWIVDEVRTMIVRYSLVVDFAEYDRMTRVLLAHAAEVNRVMGDEVVKSMLKIAMRMYARAVHEKYGVAHVVSAIEFIGSTNFGAGAVYLMEIPDCQKCGLYDCLRCGKSRQLQLIELYKEWEEPVVMVVRRVKAWAEKEGQRLLDVMRMIEAKAGYGKAG